MPRTADEPLHPFSIYLLKPEITSAAGALKEPATLQSIALDAAKAPGCTLYIRRAREKEPDWVALLEELTADRLPRLRNASTAAVLFVPASERLFAYCFGLGHTLLRAESYETDFGLRVALNSIDSKKLRSLDSKRLDVLTVQTRRQSSKATPLQTFGLDITQDLLRTVTGEPRDAALGTRLSGRDALFLNNRTSMTALGRQAAELLTVQGSKEYQKDFEWVDHLKQERDPSVIAKLEHDLLMRLWTGKTEAIHLAAPEIIDYEHVRGFSFNRTDHVAADPEIEEYLDGIPHREALQIATLKRHEMHLHAGDAQEKVRSWSIYKSLVVETRVEDRMYILSEGEWFAAATTLVQSVTKFMQSFERATVSLPPCRTDEDEETYNIRLAAECGWTCTDQKLVKAEGARSRVELCDLFTPERQLIHVKSRSRSSTLSHLFAQGLVSAEALLSDREYRQQASTRAGALGHLIPHDELKSSEFEIVFAIVGGPREKWPHSLPFFSQLNFKNVAEKLHRFGFRVSLAHARRI